MESLKERVLGLEKRKVLLLENPLDEPKEPHLVDLLATSLGAKKEGALVDKFSLVEQCLESLWD